MSNLSLSTDFSEEAPISTKAPPPMFLVLRNGAGSQPERSGAKNLQEMEALIAKQVRTAGGQTRIAFVYQLVFAEEHVHSSVRLSAEDVQNRITDSLKESSNAE